MVVDEIGWKGLDWIDDAQVSERSWAVVSTVLNLWVT
jgi:hypothetical protein